MDRQLTATTNVAQEEYLGVRLPVIPEVRILQASSEHKRGVSERSLPVAIAQIRTTPGHIHENTDKIIACIQAARLHGAKLIVFPELTVPGYAAMDLFLNPEYIDENLDALQRIKEASKGITVIVGFADRADGELRSGGRPVLYNSAALIQDGKLLQIQDKELLPNYDIFFEDRYFSPARKREVMTVGEHAVGVAICEDIWYPKDKNNPVSELAQMGAELIAVPNGSPFHLGKSHIREALLAEHVDALHVPMIYSNLVGSYDGYEGEVIFDGRSLVVAEDGRKIAEGKAFEEDLFIVDLFRGEEVTFPVVEEAQELHQALVLGIKDFFLRHEMRDNPAFRYAFIGLSGGIDSAVVAALAVEALGADRVIGITMPSRYTSQGTFQDAELLAKNLGIRLKVVPIGEEVEASLRTLRADPEFAAADEDVTEENIQARIRMLNLMAYANKFGGVVLNTGNKTELALNNCTIHGDMVGALAVLGDVEKDRVYSLASYINRNAGVEIIPHSTIARIPSAELKPNQSDEIVMGAAPQVIAPLVRALVEENEGYQATVKRFAGQFSENLVRRSFQKLDASEWKRRQAPPALRVTPHAFGNGRKVPEGHGFVTREG